MGWPIWGGFFFGPWYASLELEAMSRLEISCGGDSINSCLVAPSHAVPYYVCVLVP